jgi:hypothetical protein
MDVAIALVSGPFGALALSVGLLVWITKVIFPMLRDYLETQNKSLSRLVSALSDTVAAHEKDRDTFVASLEKLGARIEKVEDAVKHLTNKD